MKKSTARGKATFTYHEFTLNDMPAEGEILLIYVSDGNTGYYHVGKYNGKEVRYETEFGVYTLSMKNYSTSRWAYVRGE